MSRRRETLLTNTLVLVDACGQADHDRARRRAWICKAALKGGKLSMANPDSVPAGKYGKQALEKLGAWAAVEASIVRAENVRAALRFVEAGRGGGGNRLCDGCQSGGRERRGGRRSSRPTVTPPITYPAAIMAGKGGAPAHGFLAFLKL